MPPKRRPSWPLTSRHELWDRLDRIQQCTGISDRDYLDILAVNASTLERLRAQGKAPSISSLAALALETDLDLERVLSGDIDWVALQKRLTTDLGALPERYRVAAFSRRRTSVEALDFLESKMGWQERDLALRRFELNPAAFSDPERLISLAFLMDLIDYLKTERGLGLRDFTAMGLTMASSPANEAIRRMVASVRSVQELYDLQINQQMAMYETNYWYRLLKLDRLHCVVEVVARSEILDALKMSKVGSFELCAYRQGKLSAAPGYIGLQHAPAIETHCIHRGDPACRFRVDLRSVPAAQVI